MEQMEKALRYLASCLGFLAILLLLASGQYYQSTSNLFTAFAMMRYSAYGGIVAVVLVIVYLVWRRAQGVQLLVLLLSGLLGLTAFYLPYQQQQKAQSVPPIHDITTDPDNPPTFVAIVPLRADAPNPPDYAGGEIIQQQRDAYPDLMTLTLAKSETEVFDAALAVVEDLGWELVDANQNEGRIEATDTTRWFGFKDDVVVRIKPGMGGATKLDVRSKSRVGRSDIGKNAERIRGFTAKLNDELGLD